MKLVFATNNLNKLAEVQKMLPNSIELLSLKDINCFDDIQETATTLEGNAKIKANHITDNFKLNCFADDTGLEVESLNGKPGVYSARYAGEPSNSENNMQKILTELNKTENRKAQFRTAICLNLNGQQFLFDGICKGDILTEKQGEKGFGYDPIFKPQNVNKSFAQMTSEEKNAISHRGLAIQKLVEFLKSNA
ncbi:non-canonical purine NTP diphosphatase [Tenacibaculum finnmarkense]|uniref:non-canonical purine NTP diphosphatase n=1 Tax=Tenacibaculum finnmarkense TaxID=2781243 RepID=UPI001E534D3B|nr:non-canonical purine NTP diphosphatase [Tenacibaculum finnmarkense]MCD8400578.1 non-canonical purine NTP diphosphatase [Tenacibaculum finnmarkense genomovar ulcerans]MCG8786009.1 non-canonical purine NTP diphosphatase [Tenacibaculum finnmarkense]MCG8796105.1 non-canonical purine NTP diphosphatase [Tenacibaculum finnmarkense]MCG8798502.1 non-canonical purine NTP diphosphatase [Tenacibaculum finnmarkense]MCG8812361.1 non-canonical purine NTP diphosphatase [Tenacibaculum finnmarkense]